MRCAENAGFRAAFPADGDIHCRAFACADDNSPAADSDRHIRARAGDDSRRARFRAKR